MLWSKFKTPLSFLAIGISLVVIILVSTNLQALGRVRVKALDNDARARLNTAVRDMRRRGIRPRINSAFRPQPPLPRTARDIRRQAARDLDARGRAGCGHRRRGDRTPAPRPHA